MFERSLDDLVEALRGCKENNRRCSVLIGAGCSKSAGIPLAGELVAEIKRAYPAAYQRAGRKNYPACMAALDMGVRRDLIGRYIDSAKINWAHIALAQLIQAGYVDRVLTTNFDSLVSRASALINVFPAVYDFAASHLFKPDQVGKEAIFHLHGQRDGFVLLNTREEVQRHKRHIRPVFQDAHSGRIWIVVGYSGDNDPVFDLLATIRRFEYGLYWVGYRINPAKHVHARMLSSDKGAYFIGGWNADDFFVSLTQKLHCFPPTFVRQPFSYLATVLSNLTDYKAPYSPRQNAGELLRPDKESRFDVSATVRAQLQQLIEDHEHSLSAEYHFLAGEYDRVVSLLGSHEIKKLAPRQRHLLSSALTIQGNDIHDCAKNQNSEQRYREAISKFREAIRVKRTPDALFNWGNALFDLSIVKRHGAPEVMTSAGAKCLLGAIAKYKAAVIIDPNFADAHNNWANALCDLAHSEYDTRAVELLNEAVSHYEIASKTTEVPDVVHNNWAKGLHSLVRITGEQKTFIDAVVHFAVAADCNPNNYSVFLSWGNLLSDAARRSKSLKTFEEAFDKYERAAAIVPTDTAVYWNWLNELHVAVEYATGAEKISLAGRAAAIERKLKIVRKRLSSKRRRRGEE